MQDVLYAKASMQRKKEFQVITRIVKEDSDYFVEKIPVNSEGYQHIQTLPSYACTLRETYKNVADVEVASCIVKNGKAVFEYEVGEKFDHQVTRACETGDLNKILTKIQEYIELLLCMKTTEEFQLTKEFVEIFGEQPLPTNIPCGEKINLDLIFSNIICSEGKYAIIDYEWMFYFPIPLQYVYFRALLTSTAFSTLDDEIKEVVYAQLSIGKELRSIFLAMEERFQNYIKGNKLSTKELKKSFEWKSIDINYVDWEKLGYYIKVFGRKGEKAVELYGGSIQGSNIRFDVSISENYDRIEVFGAPIYSVIKINSIKGLRENEWEDVEYSTTADYKEEGQEYFCRNTPVFIIQNCNYSQLECDYSISVWNEKYIQKIWDEKEQNSALEKLQRKQIDDLQEQQMQQMRSFQEQQATRIEEIQTQKNNLEECLDQIEQSRGWKVLCKIRKIMYKIKRMLRL